MSKIKSSKLDRSFLEFLVRETNYSPAEHGDIFNIDWAKLLHATPDKNKRRESFQILKASGQKVDVADFAALFNEHDPIGAPLAALVEASVEFKPEEKENSGGSSFAQSAETPQHIATSLDVYWENGGGGTYVISRGGAWKFYPELKIKKLVNQTHKVFLGGERSEADDLLLYVMEHRCLDVVLPALAGYPAGIYVIHGRRILVRQSPRFIQPKEGDWAMLKEWIDSRLNLSRDGGPDQTDYFHGQMRWAIESLTTGGPGNFAPGHISVYAGPAGCGKSFTQNHVITPMLGGRSADPSPYLRGRTDFNSEVFGSEHLLMEDPASTTETKERVLLGENLKQLAVGENLRYHQKREDAMTLSPFFRISISVNDDPDKLRVLPLFSPDMREKTQLFLVADTPFPMPRNTLAERKAFKERIESELPAYAWWLLHEFEIPEHLRSERYGIVPWHHPAIERELFDDTPGAALKQIILAARWNGTRSLWDQPSKFKGAGRVWEDTAIALEQLLRDSSVAAEIDRLVKHYKFDRMLSRLSADDPDFVAKHRTGTHRQWMICEPPTEE